MSVKKSNLPKCLNKINEACQSFKTEKVAASDGDLKTIDSIRLAYEISQPIKPLSQKPKSTNHKVGIADIFFGVY